MSLDRKDKSTLDKSLFLKLAMASKYLRRSQKKTKTNEFTGWSNTRKALLTYLGLFFYSTLGLILMDQKLPEKFKYYIHIYNVPRGKEKMFPILTHRWLMRPLKIHPAHVHAPECARWVTTEPCLFRCSFVRVNIKG